MKLEAIVTKRTDVVVSHDELNLAEFPFCLLTSRVPSDRRSISVEREVHDPVRDRIVRQKWTATGSAEHGLPTACDMDVYVALMQIAARDGIDDDRTIHFSRLELVRMQGLRPCQSAYVSLERSIKRLIDVRIHTEDAFFDAKTRRRTSQGFGILDNYKFEDSRCRVPREGEGEQLEFHFHRSWVRLNHVLHEQLQRGALKTLDTGTYYTLGYPVSRRLFRFLDRMRESHEDRYEIDLADLSRLMPLRDARPSRQLRDLAKAHEELGEAGYLETVEERRGKNGIRLVYTFGKARLDPKVQELVARGVSIATARSLVAQFPNRIDAQIAAFDRRMKDVKEKKLTSPGGYLRRAIECGWSAPPEQPERPAAPRYEAAPGALRRRGLGALFTSLDEPTQREIETRAEALARAELGPAAAKKRRLQLAVARQREEILAREYACEDPKRDDGVAS